MDLTTMDKEGTLGTFIKKQTEAKISKYYFFLICTILLKLNFSILC
jgi:hypothetical protein